jgi:DNA invertase Pin-like site-specific DNA recombinase
MKYGYARVSSTGQNLEAQLTAMKEVGVDKIYKEKVSGRSKDNRTELNKVLSIVEKGDTLVITKIDRIARNLRDGIDIIHELRNKGVAIHVLNMGLIDNTPMGDLIINVLLAVGQFEVDMNRERQREGIAEAKKRGAYKGRPTKYTEKNPRLNNALELFRDRETNGYTVNDILEATGIGRGTLYRNAKKHGLT